MIPVSIGYSLSESAKRIPDFIALCVPLILRKSTRPIEQPTNAKPGAVI